MEVLVRWVKDDGSIIYPNQFIDEVKFDSNFLLEKDIMKKKRNKIALKNIINLAKDYNLSTVAEGVGTFEDVMFLKKAGCNEAQGYYYSKPISLKEFNNTFMSARSGVGIV